MRACALFRQVYWQTLAAKTREEYTAVFKIADRELPDRLTVAAVVKFHRCVLLSRYSTSYANGILRVLRCVVRRAATLTGNVTLSTIFWSVSQVREPVLATRCPPDDLMAKTLALAKDPAERAWIMLAGFAGLRMGEIMGLRPGDLKSDVLSVVRQRKSDGRKNHRPHYVKIDYRPMLDAILWSIQNTDKTRSKKGWFTGKCDGYIFPWGKKRVDGLFDRLRRALGPEYFPKGAGWHTFRHWGATTLAKTGASVWDVQAWLGDADPKMACRYVAMVRGETGGAVSAIAHRGLDKRAHPKDKKSRKKNRAA